MPYKYFKTVHCTTTFFQESESLIAGDLVARIHVALPERRLALPWDHERRLLRHVRRLEAEGALTERYV